jgi:hypothetical protein
MYFVANLPVFLRLCDAVSLEARMWSVAPAYEQQHEPFGGA